MLERGRRGGREAHLLHAPHLYAFGPLSRSGAMKRCSAAATVWHPCIRAVQRGSPEHRVNGMLPNCLQAPTGDGHRKQLYFMPRSRKDIDYNSRVMAAHDTSASCRAPRRRRLRAPRLRGGRDENGRHGSELFVIKMLFVIRDACF